MYELLFLLSFGLHNLEEGIWLPRWSQDAGAFHPRVKKNEFHFALLCVTTLGCLVTFLSLAFGPEHELIRYLYCGFVLMMCLNALFPHLVSTLFLRKYAPGLLTGLALNLPIGLFVVFGRYGMALSDWKLIIAALAVSITILALLRPLFKLGGKIITDQ